jgi:hypothetical protein
MDREISAAMPQRYGALMALMTRCHSNALVERRHVLEAYNMRALKSRSRSIAATFLSVLLAVVLVATGCAPRTSGTVDVPVGDDLTTQIVEGGAISLYGGDVPISISKGTYTANFSATVNVVSVEDTRIIAAEIVLPTTTVGQDPGKFVVDLYLCQPISTTADKLPDGTIGYKGQGYPQIIAGKSYYVVGVLQPGWQDHPLVYIPTAAEFRQNLPEPDKTIISSEMIVLSSGEKYTLQLKQTEYMKLLTPDDPGFSIYEGQYRGRFSFVIRNMDGILIDELGINQYFGNGTFGLMGAFVPATGDWNKDGDIDFNIGAPVHDDSGEMKYALFSITRAGKLRHINARGYKEDGFIYTAAMDQTWGFWQEDPHSKSIKVTVGGSEIQHGYVAGEYVWTNGEYVFKE